MSDKEENSYRIGRRTGKQVLRHPVGDQFGVEKLAIGTGTDSHGNYTELNRGNSNQIPWWYPHQGNHSNCKTKRPPSGSQN